MQMADRLVVVRFEILAIYRPRSGWVRAQILIFDSVSPFEYLDEMQKDHGNWWTAPAPDRFHLGCCPDASQWASIFFSLIWRVKRPGLVASEAVVAYSQCCNWLEVCCYLVQ